MAPNISQEMVYYIRHTEEEQAELRKWREKTGTQHCAM